MPVKVWSPLRAGLMKLRLKPWILPVILKINYFTSKGIMKNFQTLFSPIFFIIGSKHDDFIYSIFDTFVNLVSIKCFSKIVVFVRNIPRSN